MFIIIFFTLFGAFATVVTGLKYDEDRSNYFAFFLSIACIVILAIFTYPSKEKDDWWFMTHRLHIQYNRYHGASGLRYLRSFLTIFKRTLRKNSTVLNKFIRDWLVSEGYDKGNFFQFSFFRFDFYFSFVDNSSGSQIFVFIYFQKFNFHRLHTQGHIQTSYKPL